MNNQAELNVNSIGVYAIVNKHDVHQTTYVGSTMQSFKHRWATHKARLRHRRHCNRYLQRAWDKYGEEAFEFEIVETTKMIDRIPIREAMWLDFYRMYVPVYNLSTETGRSGRLGHPHTEETKLRIKEATSGRNHYIYGKTLPKETKDKIRQAVSGANNPFYARKHSEESREKQRAAKRGKGNPFYGKRLSEAHRAKIAWGRAKEYPAIQNLETGEIIPAGINLTRLCRERGFSQGAMSLLMRGKRQGYRRWRLLNNNIEGQVKHAALHQPVEQDPAVP